MVFAKITVPGDFILFIDGYHRTMDMRVLLVEVDIETDDIVFTKVFCNEAIYILCPFLNILLAGQV